MNPIHLIRNLINRRRLQSWKSYIDMGSSYLLPTFSLRQDVMSTSKRLSIGNGSDIKLVCTGSKFTNEEKDYLVKNKLTEQVLQLFVSDSQLVWLYKHAICFVYPSLYEGFGIPILEAFASGCPLLLSDTSCFPEIAEKGGLYFNPNDVESMADSMKRIVEDSALRERLIANGNLRLKDFSCRKMAEQTAQIYMKAIL